MIPIAPWIKRMPRASPRSPQPKQRRAPFADLNDDGVVAGADMAIVLGGWTG